MNAALDTGQREKLAHFWEQRARGERTTAVAFEHILSDLASLNADARLCEMADRAVRDEYRHAAACMSWAEHFRGAALSPVKPHSEKPLRFAGASDQEQHVLRVVFGCCFCETVAVQLLSTLHPLILHPELHRQNRGHLRDEVQHSRLGWGFLGTLGRRDLDLVRAHVPTMVQLTRGLWDASEYVEDPVLVAHGYSPPSMVAEAAERALGEVILPGLERAGVTH